MSSSSSPDTPGPYAQHPWPMAEGTAIPELVVWPEGRKRASESMECLNRPLLEAWDNYDTLFYNEMLESVTMHPTTFIDEHCIQRLGLTSCITQATTAAGLGHMPYRWYPLYPDLARQAIASARVYYLNEHSKNAQEGFLTFKVRGVHHRISFPEICDVFGFRSDYSSHSFPPQFPDAATLWEHIGTGLYRVGRSKHTDIRHPALRFLARSIACTLQCKTEPGSIRVSEMIALHSAVGHLVQEDYTYPPPNTFINLGAVFAQHLVTLKTKAFSGRAQSRPEHIGSLLTPIFRRLRIVLEDSTRVDTVSTMEENWMVRSRWLSPEGDWMYRDDSGDQLINLPFARHTQLRHLTDIRFQPETRAAPRGRVRRAQSTRSAPTTDEDRPQRQRARRPSPPPPVADLPFPTATGPVEQFILDVADVLWRRLSRLPRCRCIRETDAAPPRSTRERGETSRAPTRASTPTPSGSE